jgi:hypothetical protein
MNSALYEGWVTHKRYDTDATGHVAHEFRYRTVQFFLDLDEGNDVAALHPRWSAGSADVAWFRRRDFGGDPQVDLATSIRDEVERASGDRPNGRIAMLGQVRLWGFLFNPLTTYYVYSDDGQRIDWLVLEVRSTPWLERHRYVLSGAERTHRFAKELHVSPFLDMDQAYVCTWSMPSDHLALHLGNRRGDERIFDASLSLERVALTRSSLRRLIWRRPFSTYEVTYGIYRQAFSLWRKQAPFFTHPGKRAKEVPTHG